VLSSLEIFRPKFCMHFYLSHACYTPSALLPETIFAFIRSFPVNEIMFYIEVNISTLHSTHTHITVGASTLKLLSFWFHIYPHIKIPSLDCKHSWGSFSPFVSQPPSYRYRRYHRVPRHEEVSRA